MRIGKQIILEIAESDVAKAKESVTKMCEELLCQHGYRRLHDWSFRHASHCGCFSRTNCEIDTKYAFEKLGQEVVLVFHKEVEKLPVGTDLVVLPGGFSYGDYLRSAAIAKFSPIMKAVIEFANNGGKVLGICNGVSKCCSKRICCQEQ